MPQEEKKKEKQKGSSTKTSKSTAMVPTGRIAAGASAGLMPSGLITDSLAFGADASDEMAELAPTFGDVLMSIGTGVAAAQDELDKGLVETAKILSDTKIDVVTNVIQKLDEDGLPVADETELVTHNVSLINYLSPTVHEWKHVNLSMDLSVGEMDSGRGVSFTKTQESSSLTYTGLFWGFVGWFDQEKTDTYHSESWDTRRESDWSSGQVRLDAQLVPRETSKFPEPTEVRIGPRMYFSQGATTEIKDSDGNVLSRSVDLKIKVLKASGENNNNVNIGFDPDWLGFSMQDDGTGGEFHGSTTNDDGEVKVTLTRSIPNPRFVRPMPAVVTAKLGLIEKSYEVRL